MRLLVLAALWLTLAFSGCSAVPAGSAHAAGVQSDWIAGNKVTLLFDGPQTMAAMEAAIQGAKSSIHLETYIFDLDPVGQRFAALLMERQRAGVATRIIYDAVGTLRTPQAFFDQLSAAGIALHAFNPVNPLRLEGPWQPNNRDHRKILVVDGKVAFTGGVNISATYSTSSLFRSKARASDTVGWRDTHLQIEGPAVATLQAIFLKTWNAAHTEPMASEGLFPALPAAGIKRLRIVASEADGQQEIHAMYIDAIQAAKKRIFLTCAYFVPDAAMLDALLQAAQRGVEVRVVLPGVQEGGWVFYAGQSFFAQMLEGGIHIHQMQVAVLHAKTAVVDGRWSTVGSTNMDTRSFLHNSEINVVVVDDAFGAAMEAAFAEDLRDSRELGLDAWRQRPLSDHFKEWMARQWAYWL